MLHRFSILLPMFALACGPGRQAAWEKDAAAQQTGTGAAKGDLAAQAAEAWQKRDDRASLERAVAILEQMVAANPTDAKTLTWLSRGYYLLADGALRFAGDTELMLATFEKGVDAGERAMMAMSPEFAARVKAGDKPEDAVKLIPASGQEAIYWYASNLGKFAVAKGFSTTLFYKDRIYAVMQRVLEIDEKFFHAGPHRYFGAFYAKAPSFAGGDLDKARVHFERALELEPAYFGTKVLYAEFYAPKTDNKALFTKLLNDVVAGDPGVLPDVAPEQKIEQEKARRLLAQTDQIF